MSASTVFNRRERGWCAFYDRSESLKVSPQLVAGLWHFWSEPQLVTMCSFFKYAAVFCLPDLFLYQWSVVPFVWCHFCQISGSTSSLFFLFCSVWILFQRCSSLCRVLPFVIFSLLLCPYLLCPGSIAFDHGLSLMGAFLRPSTLTHRFLWVVWGSVLKAVRNPGDPGHLLSHVVLTRSYLGFLGNTWHLVLV